MAFQMPPLCCLVTGVEVKSGSTAMGTTGTGGRSSTLVSNFFFVGARRGLTTARSRLLLWIELLLLLLALLLMESCAETLCGEATLALAFESTDALCKPTAPLAAALSAEPPNLPATTLTSDVVLLPLSGDTPPRGGGVLEGSKLPNAAIRLWSMRFGERAGGADGTDAVGSGDSVEASEKNMFMNFQIREFLCIKNFAII